MPKTVYVIEPKHEGFSIGVYADVEDAIACYIERVHFQPAVAREYVPQWGSTVPAETMTGKGVWSKAALDAFAAP